MNKDIKEKNLEQFEDAEVTLDELEEITGGFASGDFRYRPGDYIGFDFWYKGKKYTFSHMCVKKRGWDKSGRVYIFERCRFGNETINIKVPEENVYRD